MYIIVHPACSILISSSKISFFLNFYPYIAEVYPGESFSSWLRVRNYYSTNTLFEIKLNLPDGFICDDTQIKSKITCSSKYDFDFKIKASEAVVPGKRYIVTANITRNGLDCGEVTEMIIEVQKKRDFA